MTKYPHMEPEMVYIWATSRNLCNIATRNLLLVTRNLS